VNGTIPEAVRFETGRIDRRAVSPGGHMQILGKSAVTKRSVVIGGHKTSVSLEEPFWSEVRAIADAEQITVSNLLRRIDRERSNANLSSAIRVYVLEHVRDKLRHTRRSIEDTDDYAPGLAAM
jgi:predicted DNA-binding ribbon-helix-helix protein